MRKYPSQAFSIKGWAEEDRPREKLLAKGKHNLSDAELLAILLGSGSKEESAVGLAQRILGALENNLHELGKCSVRELTRYKGVGPAKAITIAAALELGRRRQLSDVKKRPQISSSRDAFNALAPSLMDLPHEEFWTLMLNRANRVIAREQISSGGIAGTVADTRIIFRKALEAGATSLILFHNHPSRNLTPSQNDIELTQRLRKAGEILDITVLDHLIIADTGYYSFADEGKL